MKVVRCLVDFDDTRHERTAAFNRLCLLLMALGVWDVTRLIDTKSGIIKTWKVDHSYQREKVEAFFMVGG